MRIIGHSHQSMPIGCILTQQAPLGGIDDSPFQRQRRLSLILTNELRFSEGADHFYRSPSEILLHLDP